MWYCAVRFVARACFRPRPSGVFTLLALAFLSMLAIASVAATAQLALTYYFYPVAKCTAATCQLQVGFISSSDGGATWGSPSTIAGPMTLSWLPNTSDGRMVGDYIATVYNASGGAHGVFALANAPTSGGSDCAAATPHCDEAIYTTTSALAAHVTPTTTPVEDDQTGDTVVDHGKPKPAKHRR